MYFAYCFSPILGLAISSRTKVTNGSKNPAIPFGASGFFLYDLATNRKMTNKIIDDINIENTNFVIEKFKGRAAKLKAPSDFSSTDNWSYLSL